MPSPPSPRSLAAVTAFAGAVGAAALGLTAVGLVPLAVSPVEALPVAPEGFCAVYPDAPACEDGPAACTTCHVAPPALNRFGQQVAEALAPADERPLHVDDFLAGLPAALAAIEDDDADADGATNGEEITQGTDPADASSVPGESGCVDADPTDRWDPCSWDPVVVAEKVMVDVCGVSATLAQRQAFAARDDREAAVHDLLDTCLASPHWRAPNGVVWNLANRKIRPLQALKSGAGAGPIPLANYEDDYNLYVYTHTGDRDARDALTATYLVRRIDGATTTYQRVDLTPQQDRQQRGNSQAQQVPVERRAGMITHRWFLMRNTMFTPIPRTTAAQAYRAHLGFDLARKEGLFNVSEWQDYDNKGVEAPACATCHATLDPLSYPFSRYEGIGGQPAYGYNATRLERFVASEGASVADAPEAGTLFGEPVADLVEWAHVAANSRAFAEATVLDYWRLLIGADPRPEERDAFAALVDDFMDPDEHNYRVESMLHALIETEAYGVR